MAKTLGFRLCHPTIFLLISIILGQSQAKTLSRLTPRNIPRIVGGQNATLGQYPYQVSMLYNGGHTCGGSIVGPRHVATAGHCCFSPVTSRFKIAAGYTNFAEPWGGEQIVGVKKITPHPNYNGASIENDACVMELVTPLDLGEAYKTGVIQLPQKDQDDTGKMAVVTGWGTMEEGASSGPDCLQTAEVMVISNDECQSMYGNRGRVTDDMMCAHIPGGGVDSCQGDSGGPLVVNNILIGIVSWGIGCARAQYPGVYCRVADGGVLDFIISNIS